MQLYWKVRIEQQNLEREYKGEVELVVEEKKIKATFPFHLKLDPGYRMTAADHPFLAFFKGETSYFKVGWPSSQREYDSLPDEKQVMLSLMGQMVIAGEEKIISEHGLNSPHLSAAVLRAAQSTIKSETGGKLTVDDPEVQQFVQIACK